LINILTTCLTGRSLRPTRTLPKTLINSYPKLNSSLKYVVEVLIKIKTLIVLRVILKLPSISS